MENLTAYAGTDNVWGITLCDEQGNRLVHTYAGTEPLELEIAPGHGHPAIATTDTSVTWDDPENGVIKVRLGRAATLPDGGAYLSLYLTDGASRLLAYEAWLNVEPGPGTVPIHRIYATMADVRDACPWIATVIAQDPSLDADLGLQRGRARSRIDDIILSRAYDVLSEQYQRHAPILVVDPIHPTDGVDGGPRWGPSTIPNTTIRDHLDRIRGYLDADRLIRDDRLTEAAARLAVSFALEHVTGAGPDQTPYQQLGDRYRHQALTLLRGWVARIDTDGDGVVDLEIR